MFRVYVVVTAILFSSSLTAVSFWSAQLIKYNIEPKEKKIDIDFATVPTNIFVDQNNIELVWIILKKRIKHNNWQSAMILVNSINYLKCKKKIKREMIITANYTRCIKIKKEVNLLFQQKLIGRDIIQDGLLDLAMYIVDNKYVIQDANFRIKLIFRQPVQISYKVLQHKNNLSTLYRLAWRPFIKNRKKITLDEWNIEKTLKYFSHPIMEKNSSSGIIFLEIFYKLPTMSLREYWQLCLSRGNVKNIELKKVGKKLFFKGSSKYISGIITSSLIKILVAKHNMRGLLLAQKQEILDWHLY